MGIRMSIRMISWRFGRIARVCIQHYCNEVHEPLKIMSWERTCQPKFAMWHERQNKKKDKQTNDKTFSLSTVQFIQYIRITSKHQTPISGNNDEWNLEQPIFHKRIN